MESTFNLSHLTRETLDKYRLKADPEADQTIAAIVTSGFEEKINQIMMIMFRNDSFKKGMFSELEDGISEILDSYIEKTIGLPKWADSERIKAGEKVFSLYGPEIFMLLNVSSLPMCYTCAKGARVLFDTGRLLSHNNDVDPLARRLMETAQMIVNVLAEGGLTPEGRGIVTIQKVRLIHASIRYYLKKGQTEGKQWDVEKMGEPINQEDLTGTLMSFGPVILSGLKKLNINLTRDESDAYMHCWKVVGHLMGIESKLLPSTYDEGYELATKILKHQAAKSESGMALTGSCISFIQHILPGNAFDDVPNYLMHYFLEGFSDSTGIDLSESIGVTDRKNLKDKLVLSLTKYLTEKISHLEEHKFIREITSHFNRLLLEGIIHHFNGGKNVQFFIPPGLQKDWGLLEEWKDHKSLTPAIFGNRLEWQKRTETIN